MNINELIGQTLSAISLYGTKDEIIFHCRDGKKYRMDHNQDCCEDVWIEDINGDIEDLLGTPIIMAEEVRSNENPLKSFHDSFTWTFYKFATIKGYVTIRWYGESNGCYSETVDFYEMN